LKPYLAPTKIQIYHFTSSTKAPHQNDGRLFMIAYLITIRSISIARKARLIQQLYFKPTISAF